MKKIEKIILNALVVITIIFLLWVAASWISVVSNNSVPGGEYSSLNFFSIFLKG